MNDASPDPAGVLEAYLDDMLRSATGDGGPGARCLQPAPVLLPESLLTVGGDAATAADDSAAGGSGSCTTAAPPQRRENPAAHAAAAADRRTLAHGERNPAAATAFRFPLQCLMFRLGHHLLAIPLVRLGGVHERGKAPTRLPGSPPWLLGMLEVRGTRLHLVDGPGLLTGSLRTDADYSHLLVLDGGRWAMTCDAIEQVIAVESADVEWRAGGLRSGTLRQSLAALLDPGAIVERLEGSLRPGSGNAAAGRPG